MDCLQIQRREEIQKRIAGGNAIKMTDQTIDYNECLFAITQYLVAQGWTLISAEELASQIYPDLQARGLSGQALKNAIQTLIWQRYAQVLHESCHDPNRPQFEQAWNELRKWIEEQIKFLSPPPHEPDVLLQETLLELHRRLLKSSLEKPVTFFVYCLQTLRTTSISLFRRQSAIKRGEKNTIYLEEMEGDHSSEEDESWEDRLPAPESETQSVENELANKDIRTRLSALFRAHLPTPLQVQVAEAHFLDGLSPVEIAQLMGKQPHEIRNIKARIVKTLQKLPEKARAELLELISLYEKIGD